MSNTQVKTKQQFSLTFEDKAWQNVALQVFCKRYSLGNAIAKGFGVEFDGAILGKQDTSKLTSIRYWGPAGSDIKVQKALEEIKKDFDDKLHVDKDKVTKIVDQIASTGSYVREQFVVAAGVKKGPTGGTFTPKTEAQQVLFDTIDNNDITFAVGPAGTGKTHVAMIKAVQMLKANQVSKILMARPAQEAGEKLGHLPGDMKEKLDPYMRPLYDELDKAYGPGAYKKMIDSGKIELCPVGMMRGRTFADCFIILDEAQNCNRMMIKMALTRFGEGSKMVVTGDPKQSDLPRGMSGLAPAVERLEGKPSIGAVHFSAADVVRHKVVQTVVTGLGDDFDAEADFNQQANRRPQPAPANTDTASKPARTARSGPSR